MTKIPAFNGFSEVSVLQEGWFEVLAMRKRDLSFDPATHSRKMMVAVFGSAKIEKNGHSWKRCFNLGKELARNQLLVVNGGYGGVMEASAAGAKSANGITVGITCGNLPVEKPNPFIEHEWATKRWDQRLLALVWLSDCYVVMPGGSGTLVELSMVIETQLKGFIPRKPVVCLGKYWEPVVRRIAGTENMVHFARNAKEAVDLLMSKA